MAKAYRNDRFLLSPEAREIRILSEYLEPRARLVDAGVRHGIVFFGSARLRLGATPDYCRMAIELAERLAAWTVAQHEPGQRYHFCTGGGPGIMQAVSEGVARVDKHLNIGLNISLPHEQHANPFLVPELSFDFHYFFMRKFWFANLAQALVAFPGGYGTMDELFELLTLIQTDKIRARPIVLFGREFWDKLFNFRELVARGLVDSTDIEMFQAVDDVDTAFEFITTRLSGKDAPSAETLEKM
ncbi:MAG TPA: LOG family protein [Nevskiaceae bacterium]|nr:LOG family protein [Nevskiaceae bacterium]